MIPFFFLASCLVQATYLVKFTSRKKRCWYTVTLKAFVFVFVFTFFYLYLFVFVFTTINIRHRLTKSVSFCSSSTDTSFIKIGVCYQKLLTLEFNFHYRLSSHYLDTNYPCAGIDRKPSCAGAH